MKQFLLAAAVCVSGFMSAKDASSLSFQKEDYSTSKEFLLKIKGVKVTTWCGEEFFLPYNDQRPIEELLDEAQYLTEIKCGTNSPECFDFFCID